MGLRLPNREDLLEAAARNNLTLSEEEVEGYLSLSSETFSWLDILDQMPVENPLAPGVARDPGVKPRPEDDPYNAIVRRCSIKGPGKGKLTGVRVGLKDNISMAGVPMTCGSRLLSGYVPQRDATVATRLLSQGAEIVAVLNMDDFAWSGAGDTSAYGPTLNPHNT
ncbi:MAG: amidase, partial [Chloroflexi bacterium]|nr:amidase [Chloroflexota bacterium]